MAPPLPSPRFRPPLLPSLLLASLLVPLAATRGVSGAGVIGATSPSSARRSAEYTLHDRHPPPSLPVTLGAGTFSSAQELRQLLRERGCDVDAWGADREGRATKTVDELWEELETGECDLRLDAEGIRRQLNVVKVRVRRPNDATSHLVEAAQLFADGRTRLRGLPLSEKMFPGENALDAAERGIVEELGSAIREQIALWPIELEADSLVEWAEMRTSRSYPDLISHYYLFQVDAVVHGLPSESFSTIEYDGAASPHDARLKLAHRWDWVGLLSIDEGQAAAPDVLEAASLTEESESCVMYIAEDRSYSVIQQGVRGGNRS